MKTPIAFTLLVATLLSTASRAELPTGWFNETFGDKQAFEMTTDASVQHSGKPALAIRSRPDHTPGEGSLATVFAADVYRGKRMRFSASVKTEGIAKFAGLFMRVSAKGENGKPGLRLRFDNLARRTRGDESIKGTTDWKRYEIVLDVPPESYDTAIGVYLVGTGALWMADPKFEEVGLDVPVTSSDAQPAKLSAAPQLDLGKK